MDKNLYNYNAKLERVIDGDTIVVTLDLGLNVKITGFKIRLARINAPEVRGPSKKEGLRTTKYLKRFLGRKRMIVQTVSDKKDKYGRYLGYIYVMYRSKWVDVNDRLVDRGYAVKYKSSIGKYFIY